MIILRPRGGLCNRLRVIDSALSLAKELQTQVEVIWLTNPKMIARFQHLFEPVPGLKFRFIGKFAFAISSFQQKPFKRFLSRWLHRVSGVQLSVKEKDNPEVFWNNTFDVKTFDPSKGDIYSYMP